MGYAIFLRCGTVDVDYVILVSRHIIVSYWWILSCLAEPM